jgi:hypothetical protein
MFNRFCEKLGGASSGGGLGLPLLLILLLGLQISFITLAFK